MANTRSSLKRVRQTTKKNNRNRIIRGQAKGAVKDAITAITKKDAKAKEAYTAAVTALDKAASKGAYPKARISRKISRLTHFAKKNFPEALNFQTK